MMNLCTPALIYFAMAIVSIVILLFSKVSPTVLMGKTVIVLLWTWFLNFVCKKGFTTVSWVLVVSPYICLFTAMAMGLIQMEPEKKKEDKENLIAL